MTEGLNGGGGGGGVQHVGKFSLPVLCRLSVKIFDLCRLSVIFSLALSVVSNILSPFDASRLTPFTPT